MNQDSSPKTHPKSFKPPTPEVSKVMCVDVCGEFGTKVAWCES